MNRSRVIAFTAVLPSASASSVRRTTGSCGSRGAGSADATPRRVENKSRVYISVGVSELDVQGIDQRQYRLGETDPADSSGRGSGTISANDQSAACSTSRRAGFTTRRFRLSAAKHRSPSALAANACRRSTFSSAFPLDGPVAGATFRLEPWRLGQEADDPLLVA